MKHAGKLPTEFSCRISFYDLTHILLGSKYPPIFVQLIYTTCNTTVHCQSSFTVVLLFCCFRCKVQIDPDHNKHGGCPSLSSFRCLFPVCFTDIFLDPWPSFPTQGAQLKPQKSWTQLAVLKVNRDYTRFLKHFRHLGCISRELA